MTQIDGIQKIINQWKRERPDLDSSGFAVVGRIMSLAGILNKRISKVLEQVDLNLWAFDVLATLRRQGDPFQLTPTELSQATMLTSGAMTNRLDRLEEAGLLKREHNREDRRGIIVVLTDKGKDLVDRAVALRFEAAKEEVLALTDKEQSDVIELLSKMILTLAPIGETKKS
jgi:DNA-binding MarR family transcriptional regulator